MIELVLVSLKTGFDISQTLAIGELSKGHAKILVEASEFFDLEIALVSFHAFVKDVEGQMLHYLREDYFPAVHIPVLRVVLRADDWCDGNISSR